MIPTPVEFDMFDYIKRLFRRKRERALLERAYSGQPDLALIKDLLTALSYYKFNSYTYRLGLKYHISTADVTLYAFCDMVEKYRRSIENEGRVRRDLLHKRPTVRVSLDSFLTGQDGVGVDITTGVTCLVENISLLILAIETNTDTPGKLSYYNRVMGGLYTELRDILGAILSFAICIEG